VACENDHVTIPFIIKVYHDFKQTTVPPNIGKRFHALGLDLGMRTDPERLLFDEEQLRGSVPCSEFWSDSCPLDQLSIRRRISRFAWIDKLE
jgi:hypothetical protein